MAEVDVLTAAEMDIAVDSIGEIEFTVDPPATTPAAGAPDIRILKGNPTDAEIAALVCVLAAAAGSGSTEPAAPTDNWGRSTLMHRGTSPFSPYAYPLLSHLR